MDYPSSPNLEACTSKTIGLEIQDEFGRGACNSDAASEGLYPPLQDDTEAATPIDDPEGSNAVKILDKEIAELEKLIVLQGKKLDALQRLREQWVSGQRRIPDTMPPSGKLSPKGEMTQSVILQDYEGISDYGRQPWDEVASMNQFEHHAIPFVRIPLSSPLVDMEMLSFRLKRSNRASGTSSKKNGVGRPGFLTVLACLHADGVVRLRDTSGEEVLAFDAGHDKALSPSIASERSSVVGLYGDASESNPVVVSVGEDGSVRVHALKVYLRGKRVAGGARDGKEHGSRKAGKARTEEGTPSTSGRRLDNQDGLPDFPPETAIGVAMASDFQVCLGPSCASRPLGEKLLNVDSEDGSPNKSVNEEDARIAADGLPSGAPASITSVDVFYHRAMSSTIVVAGYSSGGVRFYHGGNGTVLGSSDAESSVLAVKRGGQSIAYSDGSNVRFVSVSSLEKTPDRVCRGVEGHVVTAMTFDTASPGTLYVGYETGMVMAFNSKIQEVDGSYRCLPVYRLEVPQFKPEASPRFFDQERASQGSLKYDSGGIEGQHSYTRMSTVRGYAIATWGPLISVYNTTEEIKLLFVKSLGGRDEDCETVGQAYQPGGRGGPVAPRWRAMSSPVSGEALMVEIGRCKEDVLVYKAILPFERKGQDMIWMRLPVILLGLLVVAITQVYMKKTKTYDSGSSRRSRRNRKVRFGSNDDGGLTEDRDLGLSSDLADIRRGLDSVGSRGWERSETDSSSFRRATPSSRRYGDSWDSD